jgi:hypothetical protein
MVAANTSLMEQVKVVRTDVDGDRRKLENAMKSYNL